MCLIGIVVQLNKKITQIFRIIDFSIEMGETVLKNYVIEILIDLRKEGILSANKMTE